MQQALQTLLYLDKMVAKMEYMLDNQILQERRIFNKATIK